MKQELISEIEISYKPRKANHPIVNSSDDIYKYILQFYPQENIGLLEQFTVAYLNRANRIIGVSVISKGGLTGTIADPRLILATALKAAATGIVLCHNHPSGNLQPSTADVEITKKIESACKFLDINLLDHIIISPYGAYYSFADEGLLKCS
jgi:DNA repair protein RadC